LSRTDKVNLILTKPFVRDRFTWLAYFMLAYYAYFQASFGPFLPFLRGELNMNYTVAGLHTSAFAVGMIVAGLTGERLAGRLGRRRVFWGGGASMALGALMVVLGRHPMVTIASTLFMSITGSFLLVMIQATLSDKHGEWRAIPLTESNVAAGIAAGIAPLLVGQGQALGFGWRIAIYVGIASWVFAWLVARRFPVPESRQPVGSKSESYQPLPKAFWAYWLVVFFSVGIEWCMIVWAADYMEKVVGLTKEAAATSISLFFVAFVLGRAAGSRLTHTTDTSRLLLIAILIIAVGFPLFWLAALPLLNMIGLFLCGLGVANLYPLTLAITTRVGADQPNKASARTSMGSGVAMLVAPLILASAADQVGIQAAYGVVVVLLIAVWSVTLYANRLVMRPAGAV
jgi:fucose permease